MLKKIVIDIDKCTFYPSTHIEEREMSKYELFDKPIEPVRSPMTRFVFETTIDDISYKFVSGLYMVDKNTLRFWIVLEKIYLFYDPINPSIYSIQ